VAILEHGPIKSRKFWFFLVFGALLRKCHPKVDWQFFVLEMGTWSLNWYKGYFINLKSEKVVECWIWTVEEGFGFGSRDQLWQLLSWSCPIISSTTMSLWKYCIKKFFMIHVDMGNHYILKTFAHIKWVFKALDFVTLKNSRFEDVIRISHCPNWLHPGTLSWTRLIFRFKLVGGCRNF